MATETQQHPLTAGTVTISRNGNHQYWVDDGPKLRSVTSLATHIGGDTFGVGMNWALKVVRENGGDLDAPKRVSKEALDSGVQLHDAVDAYIKRGTITEDRVFMAWYNALGNESWLASEVFLVHPTLHYGGTADALAFKSYSGITLYDWKTVDQNSWQKYGCTLRINKDSAQLAAYASALTAMGSTYAPTRGCIAYVMRDGSGVEVVEADLERGERLFQASRSLYLMAEDQRSDNSHLPL
jgi:hypothetical protein